MPTKKKQQPKADPVTVIESGDADTIRREMEKAVEGWSEMPAPVREQIVALNVEIHAMHRPPVLSMEPGSSQIGINKKNPQLHTMRLMKTFASSSGEFINFVVTRLAQVLKSSGSLTADNFNAALAFIDGLAPKNEAEATLAMQMFVTNDAALRAVRVMNSSEWTDSTLAFGNMTAKLMRTFSMQAETFAKLQRGGVQRVEHYYIDNRGGQAVIADTVHTGGQNGNIGQQSHAATNASSSAPLLSENPERDPMPISSGPRPEAMPDAWRHQSRRA